MNGERACAFHVSSPFSDRAPLQKSAPPLFATGTPDTQAAQPVTMEPRAEEEALPTFTFGEPSPVAAPATTFNRLQRSIRSFHRTHLEAMNTMLPVNDLPILFFLRWR